MNFHVCILREYNPNRSTGLYLKVIRINIYPTSNYKQIKYPFILVGIFLMKN